MSIERRDGMQHMVVSVFLLILMLLTNNAIAGIMYWTDQSGGIRRANTDGSNVEYILWTSCGLGIAIDQQAGKMYFSTWGNPPTKDKIQRADLDGSNVEDIVIFDDPTSFPRQICLDLGAQKIYWPDSWYDIIYRANLDGSNVEKVITGLDGPYGLALDLSAGKIYWADCFSHKIRRAALDGTNMEDVLTDLGDLRSLAIDEQAGKLYWTNYQPGMIGRANLDGTNVEAELIMGLDYSIITLDVSAGKMYWTETGGPEWGNGMIKRANLDGSNIEVLLTGLSKPTAIDIITGGEEPPEPPPEPWSFVHITDPHIGYKGCLGEKNAATNVDATISQILELNPLPDFVLVTGDIGDWGCNVISNCLLHSNYDRFLESMKKLDEKGISYYVVPGNHDRTKPLFCGISFAECNCSNQGLCCYAEHFNLGIPHFKYKGFLFIGFDSGKGYPTGEGLKDPQYDLLDALGQVNPDMPKILYMHHPGVDPYGEDESIERKEGKTADGKTIKFLDWCDNNKVRLVLAGHTHEDHVSDRDGNPSDSSKPIYVQTPSCGISRDWLGDDPVGFRVININSPVDPRPYEQTNKQNNMVEANLYSPGNLHIYDSDGGHVGIVDGGEVEYGIPDSFYHIHYTVETEEGTEIFPEKIIIFDPTDDYLYEVIGTEGGTYGLDITYVSGGEEATFKAADIPTSPGARHVYAVNWEALSAGEEGVILNIDNDGDGVFVQMVIADNDLSYDEFALQTETVVDFDPDTLNLNSQGKFVTVYIELPDDFDVSDIDLFSLALNELVPPLPKPIEIGDYDSDGTNDLMVKFDLQELIAVLEPGEQIIDLTGRLWDGRPIAGFDFIRVIH